jgi:soluble lytic murein transglycosylase
MIVWWALALAAPPGDVAVRVSYGDCRPILESTAPALDDVDRLTLGWCRRHGPDPESAIAILTLVDDPGLKPWASWIAAEAALAADDPQAALTLLGGVALPGASGSAVRLARGEALVRLDRSLEARPDLRALTETAVATEARYWLAYGAERRGEITAAKPVYQKVWTDGSVGPWDERAAEALARIGAPVPDLDDAAGVAMARSRVSSLLSLGLPEEARMLADQLPASPETGSQLQIARARFAARDYAGAVAAFGASLGPPDAATGSARDLFDYALATARAGDYATADRIYERVTVQHPTDDLADFAAFKRGYMAYDARDADQCLARFDAFAAARPASRRLDEALWFAARCARHQGDATRQAALLRRLLAERSASPLAPGALYWLARIEGEAGNVDTERAEYEDLLANFGSTGWAWFAAERLGRTFPRTAADPPAVWPAAWDARSEVRTFEALMAAGLPGLARDALRAVERPPTDDRRATIAYARALLRSGDPKAAKAMVASWCGGEVTPDLRAVCLPRPERAVVEQVGARLGTPTHLAYAIMTAESGLDPSVSSGAGARGLMQVMPAQGPRMQAQVFGSPDGFDANRLFEPACNAALGTGELGHLTTSLGDRLDGPDAVATIAGYNGGEEAVRRWIGDGRPAFDDWAEDVGYTETRSYVRRVLGYWMQYRRAYGD